MATIFITGSTDGLGRAAAQSLADQGHRVLLHARSAGRTGAIGELASRSAGIVVGDLARAADVRSIADQVNAIGRMDAIIHNAGVYTRPGRGATPGPCRNAGHQYACTVHADRFDRTARPIGVSQQRIAPGWRGLAR